MKKTNIDRIISEEISRLDMVNESSAGDIGKLIGDFLKKRKDKKKKKKDGKPDIRKKKVVGGTVDYDYDDYQKKNRKVDNADYDKIVQAIDQNMTDIAAVARKVYPDHTDEGGQSQLRKVLNGDRPMTNTVANKLKKLISRGQVAVK